MLCDIKDFDAIVSAEIDASGELLSANRGFLRLIGADSGLVPGLQVAGNVIQPRFAELCSMTPGADGELYSGLICVGEYTGENTTLRGRVWRTGSVVHLLAEHEIEGLEHAQRSLRALNADYAQAQLELARANHSIQRQNMELEQRVLERTHALNGALLLAEVASRSKTEFLRNMSHELLTPLNHIIGYTHLLQWRITEPAQRANVEHVANASQRLLALINNILHMSQLLGESAGLEIEPIDLASLIGDALAVARPAAQAKGLELVAEVDPGLPLHLVGDGPRLGQALGHLLSNATKFSNHGVVTVRAMATQVRPAQVELRLEVSDQGVGVAYDKREAIFNLFEQVDGSTTRRQGGAGLGLALAKQLIERMNGQIGVESVPGEGATFWILLSLPRADPPPP